MALQAFGSLLHLVGEYLLDTPLRISVGPDLEGIMLDEQGKPIIPASTFRGALRSYIESAIRGAQTDRHTTRRSVTLRGPDGRQTQVQRIVKLCCNSVDKRDDDVNYQGCLTRAIVDRWQDDPVLRPQLDTVLFECTCQVCRLFGAPWIAGRVYVRDLRYIGEWTQAYDVRGGLSLRRDTGTALQNSIYQRKAIPTGARFTFHMTLENTSDVEQGMILLGLRAFEAGLVRLGSDRSRGLGQGRVAIDWWNCRAIDQDHLIGALLGTDQQLFTEADADLRINALAEMLRQ